MLALPFLASAQAGQPGLVPCTGVNCDFNDLISLVQNIINWIIQVSTVVAAVLFAYGGFLYMTGGSKPANINKAHDIFKKTAIGFIIILTAWIVVNALTSAFLNEGFFDSFLRS